MSDKYRLLAQKIAQPLDIKIKMSLARIREWHTHWRGAVYVAFSGGMDSTVLLHLVRSIYPDIGGVFVDALSYPEIRQHVRATENVTILRPEMAFHQVAERYGWPVVSKRISQYVGEVQRAQGETATKRLRLTGIRTDGGYSPLGKIPDKWQYLCGAPFKIHDHCCTIMKKQPMREIESRKRAFVGIRVEESSQRCQMYYEHGCNAFDLKRPRSWPLAFWTDEDIWEYVRRFDVPYSSIYDMGYRRTGCFACPFGAHLEPEPNRFQRMRVTHPKLWRYCENIGLPDILDYIGVSYEPRQIPLFEVASSGQVLIDQFAEWTGQI